MATAKIQTGLRLNEQLYEKLRALAAQENRSLNNLMEYIAQKYVTEYEQKNGAIAPLASDGE